MGENYKIFKAFIKNRFIIFPILFTAICAYGFYIVQYSIGLDDTSVIRYYVDGRAPAMGRYTMYLLDHVLKVAVFSPFILEFINVVLLVVTAIIWMTLIKKIVGEKIPDVLYTIFACIFISFPLFNEIFVYYVHGSPGISLGYGLIAFAVLSVFTYLDQKQWKNKGSLLCGIICFYFALGLYESFALVYIMACSAVFFLYAIFREEKFTWKKVFSWIGIFILPILVGIIFRSITFWILSTIANLPNHMRGVMDFKWIFREGGKEQAHKLIVEFFGMYGVNAFFYIPIRNYLLSMVALLIYTIVKIIRKKNGWIAIGAFGILVSPWLLMPVEGVVTTYRANLGLAFACALSLLLIFYELYKRIKYKWILVLFAGIIIYNQSFDLNQWFYLEHVKYEYQEELTSQIYYTLATDYDLDKKIVFIGDIELPDELARYTHVLYGSKDIKIIQFLENKMGITLSDRFFDSLGYVYAEVPNLYLYRWGQDAFEEGSIELAKFYAMQGYKILPGTLGNWFEAKFLCQDAPCFPAKGSIIEFDDYIVVKLAPYSY